MRPLLRCPGSDAEPFTLDVEKVPHRRSVTAGRWTALDPTRQTAGAVDRPAFEKPARSAGASTARSSVCCYLAQADVRMVSAARLMVSGIGPIRSQRRQRRI